MRAAALGLALGACGTPGQTADGRLVLEVWRHATGDAEMAASAAAIERFAALHPDVSVEVQALPQGAYTESVTAAALARQLPCVLDVDQPTVPSFAWAGHLRPLEGVVPESALYGLTPGAIGRYKGDAYSAGQFDVVLALFARRSTLDRLGIRVATLDDPYTDQELLDALRAAKAADPSLHPIDINSAWGGEWASYGYGPWLASAGGGLLAEDTLVEAEGILNGPGSVTAVTWYRTLFAEGLAERQPVDDQALRQGRAVFHYTGSWAAQDYAEAFGDDLVILPPPDFGAGPRVGSGSWQWGVSRSCPHPDLAGELVSFLLQPAEIAAISEATGLVPVHDEAAARTTRFRPGGPWRLFYEATRDLTVARPPTPAYPKISSAFSKAMLDIRDGADVQEALDGAVDDIEYDIVRNRGYGFPLGGEP